ncbi:MAG: hypothetical protein DME26_12745 [Verrucomicrobia bacterium]|nr:MAG: hypothetical protein DME26_12745 [Verrucomicrobiota bacterium]
MRVTLIILLSGALMAFSGCASYRTTELMGTFSLRWRDTNDFYMQTELRSVRSTNVSVVGEFNAVHRYDPAPCWVIFYLLFGIPFHE